MDWIIILIVGAIIDQIVRASKRGANKNQQGPRYDPGARGNPPSAMPPRALSVQPPQPPPNTFPGQSAPLVYTQQRPLAGPPNSVQELRPPQRAEDGRRRLEGLTPIQAKAAELRSSRQSVPQSTAQMSNVAADFAEQRRLMDVEFSAAANEARLQTDGSIEDSMVQQATSARGRRRGANTASTPQDSLLSPQSFLNAVMLAELLSKPRSRRV